MQHDFRALRRISIANVCKALGMQLKRNKGQCPICRKNAFKITPKIERYWCFGKCKKGGDPLQLVIEVKGLSHKQAADFIVQLLGPPP